MHERVVRAAGNEGITSIADHKQGDFARSEYSSRSDTSSLTILVVVKACHCYFRDASGLGKQFQNPLTTQLEPLSLAHPHGEPLFVERVSTVHVVKYECIPRCRERGTVPWQGVETRQSRGLLTDRCAY